ncbi:MAG: ATP-dependent helicase, partial [Phycisphaerales bacterium]|nr:ATP-dependent helicase [Phycisphaerales bacterium]
AFRGSDQLAFQHFEKTWQDCTTIALEENYRSTPRILSLASDFISHTEDRFDADKVVRPGLPHAEPGPEIEAITHRRYGDPSPAAAAFILEDRAAHPHKSWSSYAVIARTNTDLERVATVLELHGIPYAFRRTPSLLQDEGIRDLMAWLKLISDPMETWEAFRILVRPPFNFPLEEVTRWHDAWRRESGKARFAQAEGEDFITWAANRRPDLDALRRLRREIEQLREYDASHRADETMYETIRRMGAADLDPLEPRRRERRIRNLAEILRFACDALDNLDPPGNLRAFWAYYDDMDRTGQEFRLESHAQLDIDDEVALEERGEDKRTGGAVSLITAHGAKGLEFDTVCIVRVRSPHGFPKKRGGRDEVEPLPDGLTGREPVDDLTEERRLFYVAMTRAERRLALIAEERKHEKHDCFFGNIVLNAARFGVRIRTEDELIEQAIDAAGESLAQLDPLVAQSAAAGLLRARSDTAESVAREQRAVRERLYGALHTAASGDLTLDALRVLQARLSDDAARLAILGALEHRVEGGEVGRLPEWVESLAPDLREFAAAMAGGMRAASEFEWKAGLKPPLSLSYTMLNQYLRCPACFFLQYVKGLRGPTSPALAFGDVVHRALEEFYARHRTALAEGGVPPDREWLIEHGRNRYIQSAPRYMPEDMEVMDRLAAQLGAAWDDFHTPDIDVLEIEKRIERIPVVVDGQTHHLVAKIDRIDNIDLDGRPAFRIVDYKTGKARDELVQP